MIFPALMLQPWNEQSVDQRMALGTVVYMDPDAETYAGTRKLVYVQAAEAIGAVGSALWWSYDTDRIKVIDTLPSAEDIYAWGGIALYAATIAYYFWMQVEGPSLVTLATSGTVVAGDALFPDATGTWDVIAPATAAEVAAGRGGKIMTTLARTGAGTLTAGRVMLNY